MANGSSLASLMFLLATLLMGSSDYVSADLSDLFYKPAEQMANMFNGGAPARGMQEMEEKAADFTNGANPQDAESATAPEPMTARKFGEGMKSGMQDTYASAMAPGSLKSAFNNAKGKVLGSGLPSLDHVTGAAPEADAPDAEAPDAGSPDEAPGADAPDSDSATLLDAEAPDAAAGPAGITSRSLLGLRTEVIDPRRGDLDVHHAEAPEVPEAEAPEVPEAEAPDAEAPDAPSGLAGIISRSLLNLRTEVIDPSRGDLDMPHPVPEEQ